MEDEIDLREMLQILWRGKFLVLAITAGAALLAVLYFFLLMPPVYQSTALLDLNPYGVTGKEVLTLIKQNRTVADAVRDLVENPNVLEKDISVDTVNDNELLLQIKVQFSDPEVCGESVKQIGSAIIKTVHDYRFDKMNIEKDRLERLLLFLDDTAEEYLLSRDNQVTVLLEEDPIYKRLLEEKAANLVRLNVLNFDLKELTEDPDLGPDSWLNDQEEPAHLVSVNKKLFIAIALLLGLMLSIFIIFVRHYFIATASISHDGQAGPPVKQNSTRE